MAQALPRDSFHRPALVRLLAELGATGVAESKQPLAERLGEWLGIKDALALSAVLGGVSASGADAWAPASATEVAELRDALARVHATLVRSIGADGWRKPGHSARELASGREGTAEEAAEFARYQRHYFAFQREMSSSIAGLQVSVRAALAAHSAPLKRLATLDAVLEQAMAVRRSTSLAKVPALLAHRFAVLRTAHQAARADVARRAGTDEGAGAGTDESPADTPEQWLQRGGWLAMFCDEMQAVLLAELELRLQPVAGLIAAFDDEVIKTRE